MQSTQAQATSKVGSMITIKEQTSPRNAARYFNEHLSRDDYYSDKQHVPGLWFGRGCQAVGLESGAIASQKDFVALCKGLRPDDGTKLTQRMKANRRCLYDVTISAPKSVSVMALVAGDDRIIAAHHRAVAATMEAAERLASTRVRKGAAVDTYQSRITGNVVCARFLHRESRELDPQLHTHCITFNVTHDPVENRFKALEAGPIYDNARNLTALYRDHLAQSLHALGYETYRDRYQAPQIRGVDVAVMGQFSKRSKQRDAWVQLKQQELGRPLSNDEVAQVVREHRARKQKRVDADKLRKAQLEQLSAEQRSHLAEVKQNALDVCAGLRPRREAPQRQPQPYVPGPWIAAIRLAVLAARTLDTDPYQFSPNRSFEDRVLWTVRHLQRVQRAKALVRQMQRGQRGISR
jgi:conjugative relaxase-like TrwC/TraI family protein